MADRAVRTVPATLADLQRPAAEGRLSAILDCCDAPDLYAKVCELGEDRAICLYRGVLDPEVAAEAPYLVRADPELVDWLHANVWKTPWGIFAISDAGPRILRKHFRRFLSVQDDVDEAVYFRYYDPRVLSIYLPTCTEAEIETFLGPVLAFGVADPQKGGATYFYREAAARPVAAAPPGGPPPLRLRPEQMEAFAQAARKRFEDRMVRSIRRLFPEVWKKAGEERTRARIRFGIERAARHGIEEDRDVRRYIHLMLRCGDDFDSTAWAREILAEKDAEPNDKMADLWDAAAEAVPA